MGVARSLVCVCVCECVPPPSGSFRSVIAVFSLDTLFVPLDSLSLISLVRSFSTLRALSPFHHCLCSPTWSPLRSLLSLPALSAVPHLGLLSCSLSLSASLSSRPVVSCLLVLFIYLYLCVRSSEHDLLSLSHLCVMVHVRT